MNVYCCQFDMAWEEKQENCRRVRAMLLENRPKPGSIILLPEMFATGFTMNLEQAEKRDGPVQQFLKELAKKTACWTVGGIAVMEDQKASNQAIAYSPQGGEVARYRKCHPFTPGGESKCYSAGNELVHFDCNGFRVTPVICYDLRFPELFRKGMKEGTTLFLVMASWPIMRAGHWVTLLQARAIENQAYVAGVNRTGRDPHFTYPGQSLIAEYSGKVLAQADDSQSIISADANPAQLKQYRTELPFLNDARL